MVNNTFKILLSFFLLTVFVSSYAQEESKTVESGKNNLTVLVKYKSQSEKQDDALSALNVLILEVKKEHNFVNIKILVDPADKTNILLYEEWSDEAYYKGDHMNTPHLKKFIGNSRTFLAGPPEITFWKLSNNYTLD
jgi:quinol monooxygenase YgiN